MIPSVAEAIEARSWTAKARCADDERPWIIDTHYGREAPALVVERFEVCAECPVRRECLADAITEQRFTVFGIWGGTTGTERTATLCQLRAARRRRLDATRTVSATRIARIDEGPIRAEAARILERSFRRRLAAWRREAAGSKAVAVTCLRCGERLGWRRRSDAGYCSARCKQSAWRARAA